jgi:ATP-binding cassette, subfamily B, bacterial
MNHSSNKHAMRDVLTFLFRHWRREAPVVIGIVVSMTVATVADLLLPVFSGRLVDAIASQYSAHAAGLRLAVRAIAAMTGLGALLLAARYAALMGIIRLTLRLMSRFASDAFWRVQRFSTDWHANNFAGSIVRRITRGMWAVDIMDDTLLLALLPALLVLTGSSLILGLRWPSMGLIVAAGSTIYVGTSIALSLRYVAPAARLSNTQDTKIGGAMADAINCNSVVKSFGSERAKTCVSRGFSASGIIAPPAPGSSPHAAVSCSRRCCSLCAPGSPPTRCSYGGAAGQPPAMSPSY